MAAYLSERGLVDEPSDKFATEPDEMPLRIPGTAVHVRLGAIREPELKEIIALVGGLGLLHEPTLAISLTSLLALARLVQVLRTEYGERSMVEALRVAQSPTAASVAGVLHGAACRHPNAGCRFALDGTCVVAGDAVAKTLADLAERGVLLRLNAVEPNEYRVRL